MLKNNKESNSLVQKVIIISIILFAFILILSSGLSTISAVNINNTTNEGIKGSITTGNDTIILDNGTYTGTNNTNITINNNRNITIQSRDPNNKATIDCQRSWFINNGGNLTLINLIIENAYRNGNGGSINNTGQLTIINCTFNNNNATSGGAIYNNGSVANLTINNCEFTYNKARNGGAIYNADGANLSINNCDFTSNNVTNNGGTIYNLANTILTNCNFTNNNATNFGGVIYNNGTSTTLNGCNFTNNIADRAGAIYNTDNSILNINNCNFANNRAPNGGALYNYINATVTANNCNFTNNNATTGGIIYIFRGIVNFNNCNFTSNNATNNGGVIYNAGSEIILTVENCNFTNNNATNGSAIYISGSHVNLTGCVFNNNIATTHGGAIYKTGSSNLNISNCNFTDNKASYNGGAIYITGKTILINCDFKNNNATNGGAICINSSFGNLTAENCNFTNNNATNGGAIYISIGRVNFTNSNFIKNTCNNNGDSIYNNGILNVSSSMFYENKNINIKTIYTLTNNCNLIDNFYFWVLDENNQNLTIFIENTINNPSLIGSFYYMNVTHNPASGSNNLLLNYTLIHKDIGGVITINNANNLTADNITFQKNTNSINNFDFKTPPQNLEITIESENDLLGFYYNNEMFYQITPVLAKINTISTVYSINGTINETVLLRVKLTDTIGNPIKGANIEFFVNGQSIGFNITNSEGIAVFNYTLKLLDSQYSANYSGNISFNGNHSIPVNLNVYKINTTLIVLNSINDKVGETVLLRVKLIDTIGNPIKGANIEFFVNGQSIGFNITNSEGITTFSYISNKSINTTFYAIFAGDSIYNNVSSTMGSLELKKIKTILTISAPTINQGKKTNIKATLKDSEGNLLKGEKITITINKKTYTATNNNKGIATFSIAGLKGGKFKVSGKYAENTMYESSVASNTQFVKAKVDLAIVKAVKVKNRNKKISTYKVTIQNKGSLKSKATTLNFWHTRNGKKIKAKIVKVKAIGAGKKLTLIVKYYPDRFFHKYCKKQYFVVNPKKTMSEITYKNNLKVIG